MPTLASRLVAKEFAVASHTPYRALLSEHIVVTSAGDYLVSWRLRGAHFECVDDAALNGAHERLNVFLRNLASPELALWTHIVRRDVTIPIPHCEGAGFSDRLHTHYAESLAQEALWANELYLTLIYRPAGMRVTTNLLSLIARSDDKDETHDSQEYLSTITKLTTQVEAALVEFEPQLLGIYSYEGRRYSQLLEFLAMLINGEWQRMPIPRTDVSDMLQTSRVLVGWETIEYRTPTRTRFGACLGIKEYPNPTTPGLLDKLLKVPFAFILTQSFTFIPKATAMGMLSRQLHRLNNAADPAVSQARALQTAADQLASNEFVMADHHMTVQVLTAPASAVSEAPSKPLAQLEQHISVVRQILSDTGMVVAREDLALGAAFWAQLPAQFTLRPRRAPITSRNFCGLNSFHHYPQGRPVGNYWGDALATLRTRAESPYFFSLHASDPTDTTGNSRRDTGHTLICGPTGSGKTVFIAFCLAMLQRAGATQIVFDKDRGLEILIRALNGTYLAFPRGIATGCNPLQLDDTHSNRSFLRSWLRELAGNAVLPLTSKEEHELDRALAGVMALDTSYRRLSRLVEFLDPTEQGGLYQRLGRWSAQCAGELAHVFDNPTDSIAARCSMAPLFAFDMTYVLPDATIRRPLTQYLFHLVEQLLDGRRLVVWLDEFSKLIEDPAFQSLTVDGLKTWRKRNGVIAFATQSPSDVTASALARTIIEQTPTKIFFPNKEASREDYIGAFGLSTREFALLSTHLAASPRSFLIKQTHESVVASLNLSALPGELKVLSARTQTLSELSELLRVHGDDPAAWLPYFLTPHSGANP